jgi:murein DD-endopeptidase MepM/ murein hydrolase activator NlpD
MKVGGPSQRALSKSTGSTVEDFYSWGEPALSPVEGEIKAVVDQFPDNPLGVKDAQSPAGNHVVIAVTTNRYLFIAHLQKGSVKAKPGQHVAVGQELGRCGNSGNTDFPHIHMHVQDTPTLNQGQGQNMIFKGINVELTGKTFENVDWPLIRGLFVWNR